jgi:7-cyano-7-deazaguanine synthase
MTELENVYFPDTKKVALSLSGGLDSTTLLYMLKHKYGAENVHAISFYYQQKQSYELEVAKKSCDKLGVNHQLVDVSFLGDISKGVSSNIQGSDIKVPTIIEALGNPQVVSYIPFRNLLFSSMLLSFAEANNCGAIALGLNSNDQYNYWDTTPEFVESLQNVANLNRLNKIEIFTPLVSLNKTEELKIGLALDCDYSLSLTCYDADENGVSCGICASCAERIMAFKNLNLVDPVPYSKEISW